LVDKGILCAIDFSTPHQAHALEVALIAVAVAAERSKVGLCIVSSVTQRNRVIYLKIFVGAAERTAVFMRCKHIQAILNANSSDTPIGPCAPIVDNDAHFPQALGKMFRRVAILRGIHQVVEVLRIPR
jgi:hypothetical protein